MRIHCGLIGVAFLLLPLAALSRAAAVDRPNDGGSIYVAPLPAVVDYAKGHGIPLDGIELADRAEDARPGDSVILLVTFFEGEKFQQWLVTLRTEVLSESERERKPPNDIVLYTITGQVLRYPGSWTAMGISSVGPFYGQSGGWLSVEQHDSHALVRTSFLNLGFDRSCLFIMRTRPKLKHKGGENPTGVDPTRVLSWSAKPFSADKIREGRRLADEIGMTPDDDRQVGGVAPALAAFLRSVEKVPRMPEMVMRVVSAPSIWSIFRQGKLEAGIEMQSSQVGVIEPNRWGLPFPVYRLPFELQFNGKPALDCALAVAEPRRPLLTSAGILGLEASNPEHREKRITVRVLATRATR